MHHFSEVNICFPRCEIDYALHPYIAEPINTATSMLYVFISLISYWLHHHLRLDLFSLSNLPLQVLVGLGSVLFHGTLRYHFQLLDELPMHWLIISKYTLPPIHN